MSPRAPDETFWLGVSSLNLAFSTLTLLKNLIGLILKYTYKRVIYVHFKANAKLRPN